jgi:transposase
MIGLPLSVRIFLAPEPTDLRRGFDRLAGMVRRAGGDPFSGHLFAFVSKRGDGIKLLTWDRGGFVLWQKRLERGRFPLPAAAPSAAHWTLDASQLSLLLDGFDFTKVDRPSRWSPVPRDT